MRFKKKKPIYGICAGMQLFATKGFEEEETPGLNWIPGEVVKLDLGSTKLKIPHMGWNELKIKKQIKKFLKMLMTKTMRILFIVMNLYRMIKKCFYYNKLWKRCNCRSILGKYFWVSVFYRKKPKHGNKNINKFFKFININNY